MLRFIISNRGVDYNGNVCGMDSPVQHLSHRWAPNADTSNNDNYDSMGTLVGEVVYICVDRCPSGPYYAGGEDGVLLQQRVYDPYGQFGHWNASAVRFIVLLFNLY